MKRTIILALIAVTLVFVSFTSCRGLNTSIHSKSGNPWLAVSPAGEKVSLCKQELTSNDYILGRCESEDSTWREVNSCSDAFLYLDNSLENDTIAQIVRLRYNYAAVLYRIIDCYEKYERMISTESVSREDTLAGIDISRLTMKESILPELITDAGALLHARNIVHVWSTFDGNVDDGSSFYQAFSDYRNYLDRLPTIVSDDDLADFKENFWEWYNKTKYVDNIDDIASLRYRDGHYELSDEALEHICNVIESEPDINRRAVLALELSRVDSNSAILYLGEILESGQYTKYLLETWLAWRASVQLDAISPSSFCTIPNNYYDMMRAKCVNTMLKQYQKTHDKYDLCMIENFIMCEILHRMGSLAGNESLATLSFMSSGMFDDPRVSGNDYLKDSE